MVRLYMKRLLVALVILLYPNFDIVADSLLVVKEIEKAALVHRQLRDKIQSNNTHILNLQQALEDSNNKIDSLEKRIDLQQRETEIAYSDFSSTIDSINVSAENFHKSVQNTAIVSNIIFCLIILSLAFFVMRLRRRLTKAASSLESTRNTQAEMQVLLQHTEENTLTLDNHVTNLLKECLSANQTSATVDHSLALKVADEIVRIETNLFRMDQSTRGYKQLVRSVQRMKDCFMSKGYEITDLLGKPYNEGMKVIANFVVDESLKEGESVITGVTKPQIIYNGKMIQAAQITVSQNI